MPAWTWDQAETSDSQCHLESAETCDQTQRQVYSGQLQIPRQGRQEDAEPCGTACPAEWWRLQTILNLAPDLTALAIEDKALAWVQITKLVSKVV